MNRPQSYQYMKNLTRRISRALQSPSKATELLQTKMYNTKYEQEVLDFITKLKQTSHYSIDRNEKTDLNRLCCIEDWKNSEITTAILKLRKKGPSSLIDRKEWEWAMGIIAMSRFNRLNKNSVALGIGSGKEKILFYLANNLSHVYVTDLYIDKKMGRGDSNRFS